MGGTTNQEGLPTVASTTPEQVIEDRLRDIEQQLEGLESLRAERDRLTRALSALRPDGAGPGRPRRGRRPAGGQAGRRRTRSGGKRAPRGSNQTAILDHVTANPGATTPQIAEATGIARPVVYSAVSRLASAGRLHKRAQDDGQVSYEIAG